MGIRETLNKNPAITTGGTVGIILIALVFIVMQIFGGPGRPRIPTDGYYTVDDGATLFTDKLNKVTPFDYNGQPAVRAIAYTADNGAHHWVQYLEKYTDDMVKKLSAATTNGIVDPFAMQDAEFNGSLVKKPGSGDWVPSTSPKYRDIVEPTIPDSSYGTGPILPYLPN